MSQQQIAHKQGLIAINWKRDNFNIKMMLNVLEEKPNL